VKKLHRRALDELSGASAALWSSAKRGFSGSHLMERSFTVVSGPGGASSGKARGSGR
jgi:hypothetical protein